MGGGEKATKTAVIRAWKSQNGPFVRRNESVLATFAKFLHRFCRIKDLTTKRGQVDPKERNWIFVYA